ncbi:hypothetical protein ACWIUD_02355 [Helicobacter sp. 23-1044]
MQNSLISPAPIALFAYNRLWHLKETLSALAQNNLAKDSALYIFLDAPKANASQKEVQTHCKITAFLEHFAESSADFKRIILVKRTQNFGLADNIIDGISAVMSENNRAIILEDDIVVSPAFLEYMNLGLAKYQSEPKVFSIDAWVPKICDDSLSDCFFSRAFYCWGWASWADRWQLFKRDIAWIRANFNENDIYGANLDGFTNAYGDFILNEKGKIKSWAIFFYLIAYKHSGLHLVPKVPYIRQIGFDGSGVHCGKSDIYENDALNLALPQTFPHYLEENKIALTRFQNFYASLKKPLPTRIKNKIIKVATNLVRATRERERE